MGRRIGHKKLWLLLTLALVGFLLGITDLKSQLRLRAAELKFTIKKIQLTPRVVQLKLTMEIPEVSWIDLLALEGFLPLVDGDVTLRKREGDGPCSALWETPVGTLWGRFEDERLLEFLIREQLREGVYETSSVKVRLGDVVLDVGSHLGTFTRFALNKGASLVVAFEPEPTNTTCFKKTFEKEILENKVILIEAAAWESPGSLRFEPSGSNTAAGSVNAAGSLVVPAVTIDETVEHLGLDRVDFVKMDIEGSERYALKGAHRTLSRFGPRMASCIYHRADDRELIPQIVLEARPSYMVDTTHTQAYFY